MAACLIKDSEYWTKLSQSGIPEFTFYSFANQFVKEHGRFPNLDEIPGSNSSEYLKNTLHIKNENISNVDDILNTTNTQTVEEAIITLNDQYLDLEIDILPLHKEAIVDVKNRPSEYVPNEDVEFSIDSNPNNRVVFNQIFDKLRTLYGIEINSISNKELTQWENIPDVKNVTAFIHNNKIYINTDLANVDAPIHEMVHLLLGSIRFKNPSLYEELISMADTFKDFTHISSNYKNKAQHDLYEEVFVQEVAKYLSGLPSSIEQLNPNIIYELHYNIKRLLDSVLMGKYSVKSINDTKLYNMSLKQLAKTVNSMLLNSIPLGNFDDAQLHRILANEKSDLIEKGDLREECV